MVAKDLRLILAILSCLFIAFGCSIAKANSTQFYGVQVVDAETKRGVPLVELRTTFEERFFTDSNGYVAFSEPGLMERDVWFFVESWGYESPAGPYGTKGVKLRTTAGKIDVIEIRRVNIAQRMYRQTGYGIFRDTALLGVQTPKGHELSLINAQVTGCDSVQTAIYKGKMRWFWQDTDQLGFQLGNYNMSGATSPLPADIDPNEGVPFTYFTRSPNGFAKEMAFVEQSTKHPIWADGLMTTWNNQGQECLVAHYVAARPDFSIAQSGLLIYDDSREMFVELKRIKNSEEMTLYPSQHPALVDQGDASYFYIGSPPTIRVKSDYESVTELEAYEGFTCFHQDDSLIRNDEGEVTFQWKRGEKPIKHEQIQALIKSGELPREHAPFALRDLESNAEVQVASGSIAWNPFIKMWTLIFCEQGGKSLIGEVWLATSSKPEGPWLNCQKIATHSRPGQNMDFYNVKQHPELMQKGGQYVYFEGTFVNTFSGTTTAVPLYNYNQLMYRLDLSDSRLKLPTHVDR